MKQQPACQPTATCIFQVLTINPNILFYKHVRVERCQTKHAKNFEFLSFPPHSLLPCSHSSSLKIVVLHNGAWLELLKSREIGLQDPNLKLCSRQGRYLKSSWISTYLTMVMSKFCTFMRYGLKTSESYVYENPTTSYLWGVCQIDHRLIFWPRGIPSFGRNVFLKINFGRGVFLRTGKEASAITVCIRFPGHLLWKAYDEFNCWWKTLLMTLSYNSNEKNILLSSVAPLISVSPSNLQTRMNVSHYYYSEVSKQQISFAMEKKKKNEA